MRHILLIFLLMMLTVAAAPQAIITFSSGRMLSGEVSIMGSRPLQINTSSSTRTRDVKLNLDDIVSITQSIEKATMERPWMYKESGKTDKVYFDGEYPLVNFNTTILLVSGEVVRGHIISVPLRFKGKGPSKIFLQRQIKGEVGQTMNDIEYISSITFDRPTVEGKAITGEMTGFGALEQVNAVDCERHVVLSAQVTGNSFSFPKLLPGKYDIFVLTKNEVLAGFSGEKNIPEPLSKNFKLADDFFPDRQILLLNGTRTLVYKRRADFYAADRHVGKGFLWHLDIWNWHQAENEWKLDTRDIPLRIKQRDGRPHKLYSVKALEGVSPGDTLSIKQGADYDFIRSLE